MIRKLCVFYRQPTYLEKLIWLAGGKKFTPIIFEHWHWNQGKTILRVRKI